MDMHTIIKTYILYFDYQQFIVSVIQYEELGMPCDVPKIKKREEIIYILYIYKKLYISHSQFHLRFQ